MSQTFYKKLLVAALLFATSSYAIPKDPCHTPKDVCCEEPSDPYAFNYAKDVGLSCPNDFYVYGDLLVMQAKEDGLEYAVLQTRPADTVNIPETPLKGGEVFGFSSSSHDWDWNLGFRVGVGYYVKRDAWNVDLAWTHFHIKDTSSVRSAGNEHFVCFWTRSDDDVDVLKSSSIRWKGKYNTLDLRFGKPYHVSRYFVFDPHIGLRFGWIDQDFLVRQTFVSSPNPAPGEMTSHNDFPPSQVLT
jgi:hypothetical protein